MPAEPKDAAHDVLTRARALLSAETQLSATASNTVPADLRRLALAMGMAALDTYLHWAVRRASLQPGAAALRKMPVDLGNLIDLGRKSVEARGVGKKDRPEVRVRNVLNDKILALTFQSPQGLESAMSMLGVTKCWSQIAANMPSAPTANAVKEQLGQLYAARNRVVHEGDLKRLIRPQKVTRDDHSATEVSDGLDWIESLLAAIDLVLK